MTKKQDRLRVALIGAGGIAKAHMRYYQNMDDVEMVAVADVALERAQECCEEYEIPAAYADYEEMLRQVATRRREHLHAQRPARPLHHRRARRGCPRPR